MPEGTIIDMKLGGEAGTAFQIIRELAKHRDPPISVLGSQAEQRPTVNVALTKAIGEGDEVRQEYMSGRATAIQERTGHETEHFRFEWIAAQ